MRRFVPDCKYEPGQIVHHRSYGYRGVIYDVDECCEAEEEWYLSNKSQPRKDQPWYHVLVDGEQHTSYVAEENLERDEVPEPVQHPMLDDYFTRYEAGKYLRQLDA